MRELDLYRQHLERERQKHLSTLLKVASGSSGPGDYQVMVAEAKAADLLGRLIADLKDLDKDSGEFIVRHLQ